MDTANSGRKNTRIQAFRRGAPASNNPVLSSSSGPSSSSVHSTADTSSSTPPAPTTPVSSSPTPAAASTGRWKVSRNIVVSIFSSTDSRPLRQTAERNSRQACWWPRAHR
jgi:hypothetical protein